MFLFQTGLNVLKITAKNPAKSGFPEFPYRGKNMTETPESP